MTTEELFFYGLFVFPSLIFTAIFLREKYFQAKPTAIIAAKLTKDALVEVKEKVDDKFEKLDNFTEAVRACTNEFKRDEEIAELRRRLDALEK